MIEISRIDITAAHDHIAGHIRRTPVVEITVDGIANLVSLKLELLQHSGSFKARGAFANLLTSTPPEAGVTAASGGNHGAAVAFAANALGVPAHIFVPEISSTAKIAKIKAYGADVTVKGTQYAEALKLCEAFEADSGALSIHAYDAPATLHGQGTLAKEFEEQAPNVDTVLIAVGGGGLIGGVAAWYGSTAKVIAVEPRTCPTLHNSMAANERVTITPSGIAADSLGAASVGKIMFEIAKQNIDQAVLVDDADIRNAQRWLWDKLRLVSEPGGATALAALLSGAYKPAQDEKIGIVVCGANTDPISFSKAIEQ
jgi:threonine dehydratase